MSPTRYSLFQSRIGMVVFLSLVALLLSPCAAIAQQVAYVVPTSNGTVSLFDLATSNLIKSFPLAETSGIAIGIGPNPRLGFTSYAYLSVVDFTIGHEVMRMPNINTDPSTPPAFTPDGRRMLVADEYDGGVLDVFDAGTFRLLRRVNLGGALGRPAAGEIESIVITGNKAYLIPYILSAGRPAIAEVDLRTYRVRSIPVPYGVFSDSGWTPNAGVTPDGKYVIVTYLDYTSFTPDLLYISTASNTVVKKLQPAVSDTAGLVISPTGAMPYGYLLQIDNLGNESVVAFDLVTGQLLQNTAVALAPAFSYPTGFAISPDGASLAISTYAASPDVLIISTSKMFSDPTHAIVGQATLPYDTYGVTIANVVTTPLGTAPTVTAVSGSVTNDQDSTIHITGTNFATGAQVRIGALPLKATVNSPTDLQVTVPKNAPAGPSLDVVVTNPDFGMPLPSHFQSGLLAGDMTINLNPAFQPQNEFVSLDFSTGAFSYYDFNQRAMVYTPLTTLGSGNLVFNAAGTDLYTASFTTPPAAVTYDLPGHNQKTITLTGDYVGRTITAASSVNPATGKPVVYEWTGSLSSPYDVHVSMIDADPQSATFNQVIRTLNGGVTAYSGGNVTAGAATPDGKYVYVNYRDHTLRAWAIAIFDVVNGGKATVVTTASLNLANRQFCMQVSPDGTILLGNYLAGNGSVGQPIVALDISNPKNPQPLTLITGTLPAMELMSFQVVGERLFAMDFKYRLLVAFNFDRQHSNFGQLGAYPWTGDTFVGFGFPLIAVSPDGSLLYVGFAGDDMISVYDANKLALGQSPLITNLYTPQGPAALAVSPVATASERRKAKANAERQ